MGQRFFNKTNFLFAFRIAIFAILPAIFIAGGFCSSSASAASYTASISTSGNINLDVSSAGNGANITTDNVGIVSTCPSGYNVSIAAKSATNTTFSDTTLYKDGDKTNTADTKKINTSTGTIASPVSILGNNNKTWGYTTQAINNGSDITINSNFVGLTNTQTNLTTSATGTSATGTTLPVYYGVSVDNTIEPGLYKMSDDAVITYYLTTSLDCTSYQVAFNPTSTAGGQTLSGTGTMDNQRIEEGVATNLAINTFTAPSGYEFKEWNTAQDGTGTSYTNSQSVTDLTAVGNTITLYAQWEQEFTCPGGYICYNKNATSGVEGTMGNQTVSNSATSITLLASNFSRTGYGFVGWSEDKNVTNSSKIYGPQETITFAAGTYTSAGLKLYAVWVASAGSLQDTTKVAELCGTGTDALTTAPTDGTANLSSVSALTDQRDNNTYAIAKLADGNCWMIENLRLENTGTDNTNGSLAQGYGGQFAGLAEPEAAWANNITTANSLYSTDGADSTINIGTSNASNRFPRYNHDNTNSRASSPTTNYTAMYSYGNYYTWAAAIADTTNYTTNNQSITNTSICPSGWRLPQGGNKTRIESDDDNDFWNLTVDALNNGTTPANYDSSTTPYYTGTAEAGPVADKLRSYPNNFVYSGSVDSAVYGRGSYGRYWSSTAYLSNNAYYLYLYPSGVYPGTDGYYKYSGRAVRCVIEAPAPANTVQYNPNGSDVEGTMGDQTITSSDTSLTLLASNFSRTGYGFAGWSEDENVTNSSKIYGPQETITFAAGTYASAGLKLYAVWVASAGSIQDQNTVTSVCSNLTQAPTDGTANLSSVSALTDQRDNNTYAIAKLADGNCWMIENLRLDNSATLTTANTNNPLNNGTTVTLKHNYTDTNTYNTLSPTSSVAYNADTAPDGWCTTDSAACDDQSRLRTDNTASHASYASGATMNGDANIYGYGNYYNWYSATAGNGTYNTGPSVVAAGDICPAGWHLPYGGSGTGTKGGNTSGGFYYLNYKLNNDQNLTDSVASNKIRSYPQNFVYSGSVSGASVSGRSSYGSYWSSTDLNNTNACGLRFLSSDVYPGTNSGRKYYGRVARCVVAGS